MRLNLSLLSFVVLICYGVLAQEEQQQQGPSYDDLLRTIEELRHEVANAHEQHRAANERVGVLERDVNYCFHDRLPSIERDLNGRIEETRGVAENCAREKDSIVHERNSLVQERDSLVQTVSARDESLRQTQAGLETCTSSENELKQSIVAKDEQFAINMDSCLTEKSNIQHQSGQELGRCEEQKNTCHSQVTAVEQNYSQTREEKQRLQEDLRRLNEEHIPTLQKEHSDVVGKLQEDLRQLNENQIPTLQKQHSDAVAQCERDSQSLRDEHEQKFISYEKQAKKQVSALEEKVSGLQAKSNKQREDLKKNKKQLDDANNKFFDTRKELFTTNESLRSLKEEKEMTLIYVNFPLMKNYVVTFYNDYLKEFCDPIIDKAQKFYKRTYLPWYKKTAVPAVKEFAQNMEPILQQIYRDAIVPVIDILEEKQILPAIRDAYDEYLYKTVLAPFHKQFTQIIKETSKTAYSYMKLNGYSPTLISTAQYIRKHPGETAILYYKIFALWFGIILFKLIFLSGGSGGSSHYGGTHMNGASNRRNKPPLSPAQKMENLYEMEKSKKKQKKVQ